MKISYIIITTFLDSSLFVFMTFFCTYPSMHARQDKSNKIVLIRDSKLRGATNDAMLLGLVYSSHIRGEDLLYRSLYLLRMLYR